MKKGDVIKYNGVWGVVEKIECSYAIFRYQPQGRDYWGEVYDGEHYHNTIDLVQYYEGKNHKQFIKYKLLRIFDNIWEFATYDSSNIIITINLMFLFAMILVWIYAGFPM